jgi:subtilisin family serine protease
MDSTKHAFTVSWFQALVTSLRSVKRHLVGGMAVLVLVLLVFAHTNAQAQLRGLGGGAGGIGGVAPGIGNLGLPNATQPLSGGPDRIGTGVSNPLGTGNQPALARPDLGTISNIGPTINSVTNTLTGTVANTLSIPGQVTNGLANTVNPLGRNLASAPARRSGVPPVGERRYVPNEVIVSLPANLTSQALDALGRRHGLTRLESHTIALTGTTFHRWRITDRRSVSDVIRALEADTRVRTAQPNYRFALAQQSPVAGAAPAPDPMQYVLEKLQLPQAHRFATGDKVLVAVIDSGVDTLHPEIAGRVAASFDALNSQEPPHAHGTAMAGAIIAHAQLKGVAPSANILAIRAFGSSGAPAEGTTLVILNAIDWAVAHGARVINMSFTGPTDPQIARGLAAAHKKNVVLVAAAGNAGAKSPPLFPASDINVIAVTATDSEDKLLPVANRGKYIALAAPGVAVLAAGPGATYYQTSGTSIAAAHVSGVAALILERKPDLTADGVRKILLSTATDLGPKGRDDQFGAGLANAYGAILSLTATAAARPEPTATAAAR